MLKKISELLLVLFILALTVITLIGIYRGGIIFFGDTDLTYHFSGHFFSFSNIYIWNDYFQSGSFDYNKFQGLFIKKLIYIVNSLVNNLYFFSYLWFFLPYLLYAFSFYFLIRELIDSSKLTESSKLYTAVMLSLVSLVNGIFLIYSGQILPLLGLIMINIFLLFFIKNLNSVQKTNKNNYVHLIIMALSLSESTIYIQTIILLLYVFFILAMFYWQFIIKYWKQLLIQVVVVGTVTFLLNASWIFPVISQQIASNGSYLDLITYDQSLALGVAEKVSQSVYLHELLRMKSFTSSSDFYLLFTLFGAIPLIIFILGIIKNRNSYFLTCLLTIFLVGLFFSYGIQSHTKNIYMIFWSVIPLFTTFRTVMKFSFINLYVIIIALSYIITRTESAKKRVVFYILLLLFLIGNFPLFRDKSITNNLQQYKIPNYYSQVKDVMMIKDKKVTASNLLLPALNWHTQYYWAPKNIDGMNILPFYLGNKVLVNGAQYNPDGQFVYNLAVDDYIRSNNIHDLQSILNYGNIDTIVYQKDIRFSNDPIADRAQAPDFNTVQRVLRNKALCTNIESKGELLFCKLNKNVYRPIIHPINDIVQIFPSPFTNISYETAFIMGDVTSLQVAQKNSLIYFANGQLTIPNATDIYMSSKAFPGQDCKNVPECNLFVTVDIPEGEYKVYLKHTKSPKEKQNLINSRALQMYFGVDTNYLQDTANKINSGQTISTPMQFTSEQLVTPKIDKDEVYLGEINLTGSHMVFQTELSEFFSNSRFYFVKENNPNRPSVDALPVLEFTKINPTKYLVRIHQAKGPFFINFFQNFNKAWQVYILNKSVSKVTLAQAQLSSGDTLQASQGELQDFITKGWVTQTAESTPKFISTETMNSIQNDNIDASSQQVINQIDDKVHFMSDSFANAWLVNPNQLCDRNSCTINDDKSVDIDLMIEFSTQKSLETGLFVSYITFIVCCITVGYLLFRNNIHKS